MESSSGVGEPWRPRPIVVIESPLRGDVELHCAYADCLMYDSLQRGEAPFLGHLLYPRVWNDGDPEQRRRGIEAHCAFLSKADYVVVGHDFPITEGTQHSIELAQSKLIPIKMRKLGDDWRERYKFTRTAGFY